MSSVPSASAICGAMKIKRQAEDALARINASRTKARADWFVARRAERRGGIRRMVKGASQVEKEIEELWRTRGPSGTSPEEDNAAIGSDLERTCNAVIALCDSSADGRVTISLELLSRLTGA